MPTVVPSVTEASDAGVDARRLEGAEDRLGGAAGVDGALPTMSGPVSSSSTTRSVKVPPVSMPA